MEGYVNTGDVSEKRAKFIRLAEQRGNKACERIALLAGLSNRSSYDYDEHDVAAIHSALIDQIDLVMNEFDRALKGRKKDAVRVDLSSRYSPSAGEGY